MQQLILSRIFIISKGMKGITNFLKQKSMLGIHFAREAIIVKDNLVDSVGLQYYEYMNFQRLT